MQILGIDIGGTGIKGAPVDTVEGRLLSERFRLETPEGAKPADMAQTVADIAGHFEWKGPIGVGFPAAVRHGVAMTAANISKKWIGVNVEDLLSQATHCPVKVVNDADAAGIAEMHFGAGRGQDGVVLIVTIGTGLGISLFTDGHLLPNVEMGHIEINGKDAELTASDAARRRNDMSWDEWAKAFNLYLTTMEKLLWPDLIILGGGLIKKQEKFMPALTVRAKVVPAQFMNDAGTVGAALAAIELAKADIVHPGG
jgi:polyphosphate glucokinase